MGMFQNMVDALFPDKLVSMCKKEKGSVGEGFKYLIVAGIVSLVLGLVTRLVLNALGVGLGTAGAGAAAFDVATYLIGGVIALVVGLVLTWLVLKIAHLAITALLKAKAGFGQMFFCVAVLWSAVQILNSVLSLLPCIGAILMILLFLYSLYLLFMLFKAVYGFDTGGAIAALVVLVVVSVVIYGIFALVVMAALLGLLGLGALGTSGVLGFQPVV
ncbi:MAG: hypothetical protein AB1657_05610 [Candidatus Micrarchaeota archaeon]